MGESLFELVGVGLAALAFLAVLYLLPTVARLVRKVDPTLPGASASGKPGEASPELIAVIAAAVAAASGMGVNEFRVVGVNRVEGSGGFNTPVWGHIDRFARQSNIR